MPTPASTSGSSTSIGRVAFTTDGGRRDSQNQRSHDRADIRLEEIGPHAGHIADVVADVVGDRRRVARIVFRDAGFDLTHQVRPDIGRLGVDASTHTGKERDRARSEREARQHGHDPRQARLRIAEAYIELYRMNSAKDREHPTRPRRSPSRHRPRRRRATPDSDRSSLQLRSERWLRWQSAFRKSRPSRSRPRRRPARVRPAPSSRDSRHSPRRANRRRPAQRSPAPCIPVPGTPSHRPGYDRRFSPSSHCPDPAC